MAAVFDAGAFGYWAVPTAPPWWAAEQGLTKEPMRRIMFEVGEPLWGRHWGRSTRRSAATPGRRCPRSTSPPRCGRDLALRSEPREGAVGWAYALTLGFGLVYLGEHYVTDLLAGAGLVAAVRGADPVFAPAVGRVSEVIQRLERIADGGLGSVPECRTTRSERRPKRSRSGGPSGLPIFSTKRLLQTGVVVVVLLVSIYFLFPKLVGLGDSLDKLGEADPVWIGIAIVFSIASYATYIALFKAVVGGDALKLTWGETYEINMAGVAATLLFSAGGAGGVALTYWALKKAGMRRRDVARRMIAFVSLHYAFYPLALIVFGLLLRTGVLNGEDSVELTIIPAAVAGLLLILGVLITLIPADVEARLMPHAHGDHTRSFVEWASRVPETLGRGSASPSASSPTRARAASRCSARRASGRSTSASSGPPSTRSASRCRSPSSSRASSSAWSPTS